MAKLSKADKKKLCEGCRNNRYNMGKGFVERPGIDAVVTVDECWSFKTAKVVLKKKVPYSMTPPWLLKPVTTLSCWSAPHILMAEKDQVQ